MSKTFQCTPGPYQVSRDGNKLPKIVARDHNPPPDVRRHMEPGEECYSLIARMGGQAGETEGNALLLAAAWDMLEALLAARDFGPRGETHEGESVSSLIDRAIAKATQVESTR